MVKRIIKFFLLDVCKIDRKHIITIRSYIQRVILSFVCALWKQTGDFADKILVTRLDGIGDVVLTSAFLRELRIAFPNAKITLIVNPITYNLVEHCPYVDKVLVYNKAGDGCINNLKCAYKFWKQHRDERGYAVAFNPRWDSDWAYGAGAILFLSASKKRIGYSEHVALHKEISDAGFDNFYTNILDKRIMKHEAERNLDILRFMGVDVKGKYVECWNSEGDKNYIKQFVVPKSHATIKIAVCPSAGQKKREWALERYIDVIEKLHNKYENVDFYIVGAKSNTEKYSLEIMNACPYVINVCGKTSLSETVALLKKCDLYFGGDTGPMHIAAACGCKGVAIFSNSIEWQHNGLNTPERFGPASEKFVNLMPEKPLDGCEEGCYKDEAHCILTISTDRVLEVMETKINEIIEEENYD